MAESLLNRAGIHPTSYENLLIFLKVDSDPYPYNDRKNLGEYQPKKDLDILKYISVLLTDKTQAF